MIDVNSLFFLLKKNKINFFCGVPDSVLKDFISILDSHKKEIKNIVAANEGSAVALAAGHYLATKKPALVYMQNSGLGNAINPLISICHPKVYSIPVILMIGWRGSTKEKDEPQHQLKGKITPEILKLLNIRFIVLNNLNDLKKIKNLINYSKYKKTPVAFLIKNHTLFLGNNYKKIYLENIYKKDVKSKYTLTREFLINKLLSKIKKKTRIISTTGYTSRELFQIRKDKKYKNGKDFYMVGGMGHSSMISLGYSLNSNNQIICLDGDGSFIMHMGSLISTGLKSKSNFKYILLNNGSHESVGDQKIDTLKIDFKSISKSFGYNNYYLAKNDINFDKKLDYFLKSRGPSFFEVRIKSESIKKLSRPKNLIRIKENFIK
jgi:phosphonopyruvate decarboxylase